MWNKCIEKHSRSLDGFSPLASCIHDAFSYISLRWIRQKGVVILPAHMETAGETLPFNPMRLNS